MGGASHQIAFNAAERPMDGHFPLSLGMCSQTWFLILLLQVRPGHPTSMPRASTDTARSGRRWLAGFHSLGTGFGIPDVARHHHRPAHQRCSHQPLPLVCPLNCNKNHGGSLFILQDWLQQDLQGRAHRRRVQRVWLPRAGRHRPPQVCCFYLIGARLVLC
jgi:hypothetical protein